MEDIQRYFKVCQIKYLKMSALSFSVAAYLRSGVKHACWLRNCKKAYYCLIGGLLISNSLVFRAPLQKVFHACWFGDNVSQSSKCGLPYKRCIVWCLNDNTKQIDPLTLLWILVHVVTSLYLLQTLPKKEKGTSRVQLSQPNTLLAPLICFCS